MTFDDGTKFMATGRNKVPAVRSVQIKVENSSITDEIRMELDSHDDTYVLRKDYLKVYNWNRPVNVSGWNRKDGDCLCKTQFQGQWPTIILSQGKFIYLSSISVCMSVI